MANMANRNNGEPQSGEFQAPKFWKGLPRILMGLSVFLFALTLVINAPTVVTLKPDDVIFADITHGARALGKLLVEPEPLLTGIDHAALDVAGGR